MPLTFLRKTIRSHKRTTSWNLVFHYSNVLYSVVIGIVLVPLYLKYISREMYGFWLATGNIIAWLTMIDPGFSAVLQQKTAFYYGAKNYKIVGSYATGGILINIGFVILIGISGTIFSIFFGNWLNIADHNTLQELKKAFNYALLGTLLMSFSFILVSINQGLQSSLGIGLIFTLANICGILLTIWLLHNGWGVVSLGIAIFCRSIIYVIGNLGYLIFRFNIYKIKLSYDSSIMKDFTSLSLYNFMGKIGSTLCTQMNAFVSSKILTPIDTTVLKFSQTVPETSKFILVRPALAITPSITHLHGEGNNEKIQSVLVKFLFYLIWGSGLAVMGFIIFNKPFITLWIGDTFYGGDVLNLLIVVLLFITIFTQSFSAVVFALGNIKGNNIALFIQSLIFVPLLITGAHLWELKGMIMAAILAELTVSGWYFPLNFFRTIKMTRSSIRGIAYELCKVLFISIAIIFLFNRNADTWVILLAKIILAILIYFGALLILSNDFRKESFNIYQNLICALKRR